MLDLFDYVFPENGLMAYHHGALIGHTVRGAAWRGRVHTRQPGANAAAAARRGR